MRNQINGLPAHVLFVHAVVILVPLAAVLAVVGVARPAARRRLGILTPLTALVALVFIPLSTSAGEWLQERVPETALVQRHVAMGEGLLVWSGLLLLLAAAMWLLDVASPRGWRVPGLLRAGWVQPVAGVVLCVVAAVCVLQVARIGDSGAKAAWDGRLTGQTGAGA